MHGLQLFMAGVVMEVSAGSYLIRELSEVRVAAQGEIAGIREELQPERVIQTSFAGL